MDVIKQINQEFKKTLVRTDPGAQMEFLTQQMKEKDMFMFGKPFPTFLKPYFVDVADRSYIAHMVGLMSDSLEKICHAYLTEGKFKDIIELSRTHGEDVKDRLIDMVKIDPLYPRCQVVNRYDLFFNLNTKALKFLEFNCGDPSGMGWNDDLLKMFYPLKVVQELAKKYEFTVDPLLDSHHRVLRRKYVQYCISKGITPEHQPTIALVCTRDSTILGDFKAFVRYYASMGYKSYLADPRDFEYDGKKLTLNGKTIQVVYRDSITDFLRDTFYKGSQPIIKAYRDGNVCMFNPVRADIADFKGLLEMMSDEKYEKFFTPEERAAQKKHIPWTRVVKERKTVYGGRKIDLIPFIRKNRSKFVLKPNSGYGGFGAFLGWKTDAPKWDETIQTALTGDAMYTVQEKVEIPTEEFPIMEGNKLKGFASKYVNINFWVHDGTFAGAFVRAADSQIVNVHQGGGIGPVFFVRAKD